MNKRKFLRLLKILPKQCIRRKHKIRQKDFHMQTYVKLAVFSTNKSTNFSANLVQNIFRKMKKASKAKREQKILISVFAYFLSTKAKNFILQGRLATRLCPNSSIVIESKSTLKCIIKQLNRTKRIKKQQKATKSNYNKKQRGYREFVI